MQEYSKYIKCLQKNEKKVRQIRKVLLISLPLFCVFAFALCTYLHYFGNNHTEISVETDTVTEIPVETDTDNMYTLKCPITFESEDATHVLSENQTFTPTYNIPSGALLSGHEAKVEFSEVSLECGKHPIEFTVNITDKNTGDDVTDFYDVTQIFGYLTVVRSIITIKTATLTKEYDGTYLRNSSYEIISGSFEPDAYLLGHTNSFIKYSGTYDNVMSFDVISTETGKIITSEYLFNVIYGTVTITPATIVIRSADTVKEYDGTPLFCSNFEIVSGNFYEQDKYLAIQRISSQTELGSCQSKFKVVDICAGKANNDPGILAYWSPNSLYGLTKPVSYKEILNSYNFVYEYGTLEVVKGDLIVKSTDAKKIYDGKALRCSQYSVNVAALPEGTTLKTVFYGTITEIGTVQNTFDVFLADKNGNDVSSLYFNKIKKEYGLLTVYALAAVNDLSSEVSTKPNPVDNSILFTVNSTYKGLIYLKNAEYNNYLNSLWNNSLDSGSLIYSGVYASPYNPTGKAPANNLYDGLCDTVTISSYNGDAFICSLYPNYILLNSSFRGNLNSILNKDKVASHTFTFFGTNEIMNSALSIDSATTDKLNYEKNLDAYLYVLYDYRSVFYGYSNTLWDRNEYSNLKTNSQKAEFMARFLGSLCSYSKNFPEVPENSDPLLYFLTESKIGICNHFATALTLLCRYAGVPARYCTGYLVNTTSGNPSLVKANAAHAWCEYYDETTNTWVVLESTKYAKNLDGSDGSVVSEMIENSGELTETGENVKLTLTIQDVTRTFNGEALTAENSKLSGTLLSGHQIFVDFTGEQTYVGTSLSSAKVSILDLNGEDVSDKYDIKVIPGKLTVTPIQNTLITDTQLQVLTEFNFAQLLFGEVGKDVDYFAVFIDNSDLPYIISSVEKGKYVGILPVQSQQVIIKINNPDLNGDGVNEFETDNMTLKLTLFAYGGIQSLPMTETEAKKLGVVSDNETVYEKRPAILSDTDNQRTVLDIVMTDETGLFNGDEHYSKGYKIIGGKLKLGHSISVYGSSVLKYVGECRNTCISVRITDEKGSDVTDEYYIRCFESILKVLPADVYEYSETVRVPFLSSRKINDTTNVAGAIMDIKISDSLSKVFSVSDKKITTVKIGKTVSEKDIYYDFNRDGIADLVVHQSITYESYISVIEIIVSALFLLVPSIFVALKIHKKKREF